MESTTYKKILDKLLLENKEWITQDQRRICHKAMLKATDPLVECLTKVRLMTLNNTPEHNRQIRQLITETLMAIPEIPHN